MLGFLSIYPIGNNNVGSYILGILNSFLISSLSNSPTIVVPNPILVASKHICVTTIPVSISPYSLDSWLSLISSSFSYEIIIIVEAPKSHFVHFFTFSIPSSVLTTNNLCLCKFLAVGESFAASNILFKSSCFIFLNYEYWNGCGARPA